MIEFLCPNGHKIHCPDNQAGRAAKCPRCGVKFRIPDTSELAPPDAEEADDLSSSPPDISDSGDFGSITPGGPSSRSLAKEPQIEFLCPNGHHLHGPASLQGRPGECPECGSRFRIPVYDELGEEEDEFTPQISVGKPNRASDSQSNITAPEKAAAPAEKPLADSRVGQSGSRLALPPSTVGSPPTKKDPPPLAQLFAKLWVEQARGATIELHFADGQVLLPDRYLAALSQQTHGVFAVKEPGGTYELTVAAWDSIAKVLVRGMKALPEK